MRTGGFFGRVCHLNRPEGAGSKASSLRQFASSWTNWIVPYARPACSKDRRTDNVPAFGTANCIAARKGRRPEVSHSKIK